MYGTILHTIIDKPYPYDTSPTPNDRSILTKYSTIYTLIIFRELK